MKRLTFGTLIFLLFTACSSDDAIPGPATTGQYNIYVSGDRTGTYELGEYTIWNPGSHGDIIVLGYEKVGQGVDDNDPIAELTIQFTKDGSNGNQQDIQKISLATKEVSMGTAEEEDRRLFEHDGVSVAQQCGSAGVAGLVILESGADFVKGTFCYQLERRTLAPGDLPETVTVHGDFTATKLQ